MRYRKTAFGLLLAIWAAVSQVGCSNNNIAGNYNSEVVTEIISSRVLASNPAYELRWDEAAKSVLLADQKSGKLWSDILYEAYQEGSTSANANSALHITVVNKNNLTWETQSSYTELAENGRIVCEELENGIRVTYYFERYKIAIPVMYELREDSLAISIDGADIQEDGSTYKLVSVSVAPYFCSAENEGENNYLFVPSGSGALMYTAENADGTRKFSGEVYGSDAARRIIKSTTEEEAVRLPVFGAKNGDTAILGIIEEGAGSAFIEAQAGYKRLGYSQVGATFYFRGYDTFRYGTYATGNAVITRISEERSSERFTVAYYPLQGEEADYNGMAKRYRQYLVDKEELKASDTDDSAYSVTLLGGTTVTKSFFGIPYRTLVAMTKFDEAQNILSELTEANGTAPVARLMAYGDSGLLPGTIGGGRNYDAVFGGKEELQLLQQYCQEKNGMLFWDFDTVLYSKSGNGFSYNSDCAKTAIHYRATLYPVTPIRLFDEDNPYHIISRGKLKTAMEKVMEKADRYQHTGLSFSTLGEVAFSDYNDDPRVMKAGIDKEVSDLLKQAGEKRKIAVSGANSYAACAADVVFDVPLNHGEYQALDVQIPFYQMVFHSYKAMYSPAVNLSENMERKIMLAAAGGTGLGFTLISEYVPESNDLAYEKLYGALYESNRELIGQALKKNDFADYFEKTADSVMVRYELLENGMILYANHTSEKVNSPAGELDAYMFKVQ